MTSKTMKAQTAPPAPQQAPSSPVQPQPAAPGAPGVGAKAAGGGAKMNMGMIAGIAIIVIIVIIAAALLLSQKSSGSQSSGTGTVSPSVLAILPPNKTESFSAVLGGVAQNLASVNQLNASYTGSVNISESILSFGIPLKASYLRYGGSSRFALNVTSKLVNTSDVYVNTNNTVYLCTKNGVAIGNASNQQQGFVCARSPYQSILDALLLGNSSSSSASITSGGFSLFSTLMVHSAGTHYYNGMPCLLVEGNGTIMANSSAGSAQSNSTYQLDSCLSGQYSVPLNISLTATSTSSGTKSITTFQLNEVSIGNATTKAQVIALPAQVNSTSSFFTTSATTTITSQSSTPPQTTPSKIVHYTTITVVGSGSASASPVLPVAIIPNEYAPYIAANMQNVEFFYTNGTIIPSWLENGTASSPTAKYWLRLNAPVTVGSSETIYMGIADTSTNLFNNVNVGEAPELSPGGYAQYDDGSNVFQFYDNFAGTALNTSKWDPMITGSAQYTVNDGLTTLATPGQAINIVSRQTFDFPAEFDWYAGGFTQSTPAPYSLQLGNTGSANASEEVLLGTPGSVFLVYALSQSSVFSPFSQAPSAFIGDTGGVHLFSVVVTGSAVSLLFDNVPILTQAVNFAPSGVPFSAMLNDGSGVSSPPVYWVRVVPYPSMLAIPSATVQ